MGEEFGEEVHRQYCVRALESHEEFRLFIGGSSETWNPRIRVRSLFNKLTQQHSAQSTCRFLS